MLRNTNERILCICDSTHKVHIVILSLTGDGRRPKAIPPGLCQVLHVPGAAQPTNVERARRAALLQHLLREALQPRRVHGRLLQRNHHT
jgi:hypothetical protein